MPAVAELAADWYITHKRDLPWRRPECAAWPILISEVMLQQTPVSRVLPVWLVWIERWPTPADLAASSIADAIRAWGRLGYPRRAMRLHACAQTLLERHNGTVPRQLEQLLALPGVGDYTARAVLSFAYQQRHAVVDTNVRRLVARAVAGVADAQVSLTTVERLLPAPPGAAAQASAALMELGALVCTARTPRCGTCPLAAECRWRQAGKPAPPQSLRRTQRYAGTDRQVRGLLLAVLRDATGPVPKHCLDLVWPDDAQRDRALRSLLDDGLAVAHHTGDYALPAG